MKSAETEGFQSQYPSQVSIWVKSRLMANAVGIYLNSPDFIRNFSEYLKFDSRRQLPPDLTIDVHFDPSPLGRPVGHVVFIQQDLIEPSSEEHNND